MKVDKKKMEPRRIKYFLLAGAIDILWLIYALKIEYHGLPFAIGGIAMLIIYQSIIAYFWFYRGIETQ